MFKGTDKFGTLDYEKEKPLLDKIEALYEQSRETLDPLKRKEIYAQIDKVPNSNPILIKLCGALKTSYIVFTLLEINSFFSRSLVEINVIIYTHKNTLLETENESFELTCLVLA